MNGSGITLDRVRGCILGGAVGDALGAPVEFLTRGEICRRFGTTGIRDMAPAFGRPGSITDDTQMTLFTAEGLIRAKARMHERGTTMPVTLLHRAYLRWLVTQGEMPTTSGFTSPSGLDVDFHPGWLSSLGALHARRAPGKTCLTALRQNRAGTLDDPVNNSKGCGGVMRVAPIGLAVSDPSYAFELGCKAAAITHGHPSGYLSAGAFASLINQVAADIPLLTAIEAALCQLREHRDADEVINAIEASVDAADRRAPDSGEVLERLGQGWIGEEALGIALYCALISPSLEEAVVRAVNHDGDSDSTGAITGSIMGAIAGTDAIPGRWLNQLELRDEIETVSEDLWRYFHSSAFEPADDDFMRYPPN